MGSTAYVGKVKGEGIYSKNGLKTVVTDKVHMLENFFFCQPGTYIVERRTRNTQALVVVVIYSSSSFCS